MAREVSGCADAHAAAGAVLALQARIDALVAESQRWVEECGEWGGGAVAQEAGERTRSSTPAARLARCDALLAELARAIADVRRALYTPAAVPAVPPVRRHSARLVALATEAAYADAFAACERRLRRCA